MTAYRDWPMAFRTCQAHPRFCWCSHLPARRRLGATGEDRLLVLLHGSERDAMGLRDAFRSFSEQTGCALLAPLFPVSPFGDGNGDGYKRLVERDLRYDLILLQMIAEFAETHGRRFGRLLMFGFSGGAQFVHRFLYTHPQRLAAASVAAPGSVTLPAPDRPLWQGLGGWARRFGQQAPPAELRQVAIQLLVGSEDCQRLPSSGQTRQELLAALDAGLRALGVMPEREVVPGAAHEGKAMVPAASAFFERILEDAPRRQDRLGASCRNTKDECTDGHRPPADLAPRADHPQQECRPCDPDAGPDLR